MSELAAIKNAIRVELQGMLTDAARFAAESPGEKDIQGHFMVARQTFDPTHLHQALNEVASEIR